MDMEDLDINTDHLTAQVVDETPRHYDFSTGYASEYHIAIQRTEEERENHRYEPMMNTVWPLPEQFAIPDDIRDRLVNMTVVEVENDFGDWDYYLALTGGGMDMSWEIAETYVNLGLYPPTYLTRLPRMAGKDYTSEKNRLIIAALRESHNIVRARSERYMNDLENLLTTEED